MIEILLQAERALEMGRIDVAESLYHQVADNDPRNAIAVVGLARVALERDDQAEALSLARRALLIDPENAAAVRMVARLEEVYAYRGESIPAPARSTPAPAEPSEATRLAADEPPAAEPPAPMEMPPEIMAAPPTPPAPPKPRRTWLDRLLRRNR